MARWRSRGCDSLSRSLAECGGHSRAAGVAGVDRQNLPEPPVGLSGVGAGGVASLGVVLAAGASWAVLAIDALAVAAALADLFTLPAVARFRCSARRAGVASLRKPHRVLLTLLNHSPRRFSLAVRDAVPHALDPQPGEFLRCKSPAAAASRSTINLRAERRGAFAIEAVYLRVDSRLGLWQRHCSVSVADGDPRLSRHAATRRSTPCWPAPIASACWACAARAASGRTTNSSGCATTPSTTTTSTSTGAAPPRRQKLTVKDYQASQSQRIIFLLDCGRMMTNQAAGLSLLDHGLNAMLMLSYVALRQGDSVALVPLFRRDSQFRPAAGRHAADEPAAARLVRSLPQAGRVALRPGLSLPGHALPQTLAGGVDDQRDRRGELQPDRALPDQSRRAGTCRWACCCATGDYSRPSRSSSPATHSSGRPRPPPTSSPGVTRSSAIWPAKVYCCWTYSPRR